MQNTAFPTLLACNLAKRPEGQRWLIEGLWGDKAVGIFGGEPKCYKSFGALAMGVAVASGKPLWGRFKVPHPGRVLIYAAEDALHIVRERLEWLCAVNKVAFGDLDMHVITAKSIRIDLEPDRESLVHTIKKLKPKFLILDPFVRLHRKDENNSGEVAPLLAFLRDCQRQYDVAITLVHHAKKGGRNLRGGQALRGSSEFHAWGDSNIYVTRTGKGENLLLNVEHRAAAPLKDIALHAEIKGKTVTLALSDPLDEVTVEETPLRYQVLAYLTEVQPVQVERLRKHFKVRNATMSKVLAELVKEKRAAKTRKGYVRTS